LGGCLLTCFWFRPDAQGYNQAKGAVHLSPSLSFLPSLLPPQRKAAEKAEKAPTRNSKSKKDPKAPKRALSAYMFFSQDWRERIKAENPDAGFGEVGKLLGAKWKEMSDEEKKVSFLSSCVITVLILFSSSLTSMLLPPTRPGLKRTRLPTM